MVVMSAASVLGDLAPAIVGLAGIITTYLAGSRTLKNDRLQRHHDRVRDVLINALEAVDTDFRRAATKAGYSPGTGAIELDNEKLRRTMTLVDLYASDDVHEAFLACIKTSHEIGSMTPRRSSSDPMTDEATGLFLRFRERRLRLRAAVRAEFGFKSRRQLPRASERESIIDPANAVT